MFDSNGEMTSERLVSRYEPNGVNVKRIIAEHQSDLKNEIPEHQPKPTKEFIWTADTFALLRIAEIADQVRQTGLVMTEEDGDYWSAEGIKDCGESLEEKGHVISRLVIGLLKSKNGWSEDEARESVSYTHLTLPTNREV